jgi:phosphoglycolate phosphatase-like HAD superfamily hydrolase
MRMLKRCARAWLAVLLAAQLPGAGWAQAGEAHAAGVISAAPGEPQNLGQLKIKLKAYHDCCYAAALDRQARVAMEFLERGAAKTKPEETLHPSTQGPRAGNPEKLALVLDIDETSLLNYLEEAQDDFGFIQRDWNAWAASGRALAVPGILRLSQRAQQLGVAVFFITGRSETLRAVTEKNLRLAGYANWAGLTMRSQAEQHERTIAYKSAAREAIVKQGYRIILNVGDQWSDLKGEPQAEYSVKLPNPFYYIP